MAVEDDMMEGSNSSTNLDTMVPKQSGDVLSVEDLAWADSCLIKDPEMSESNWDSLKDALLDVISHQPDSLDSSELERDDSSEGSDIEILRSIEETKTARNLERTVDDDVQINEATEKNNDDHVIEEKNVTSWSRTNLQNAFLPTYKGEMIEIGNSDSDVDSVFPTFVTVEPSTEDIFKVWDLNIPAEEDELAKQLDKALLESSLQPTPSTFDDSEVWKGLKEETVDDLVAGIVDLSLNQISG